MASRINSVVDLHDQRKPGSPYAGYEDEAGWDYPLGEETGGAPRQHLSPARRLERSHHIAGRAAYWLFIKGGMLVVLFVAIAMLGLVGALLGVR